MVTEKAEDKPSSTVPGFHRLLQSLPVCLGRESLLTGHTNPSSIACTIPAGQGDISTRAASWLCLEVGHSPAVVTKVRCLPPSCGSCI